MWGVVSVKGAPPPSRLDHAMTTICLPPSLNDSSRDFSESSPPSQTSPITTPTTSHPHIVTVIAPETIEDKAITDTNSSKNGGKTEPGDASNTRRGVEETRDSVDRELSGQAQSEGVDPSLKEKSSPDSERETPAAVCVVQTDSVSSVAGEGQGSTAEGLEKQRNSRRSGGVEALLVFGGMDTSGHIHSDCFIIVPP